MAKGIREYRNDYRADKLNPDQEPKNKAYPDAAFTFDNIVVMPIRDAEKRKGRLKQLVEKLGKRP